MFPYLTPEVMNLINEQRKKNIPTFEEYYNKRYLEECKVFLEKPKFSMKYIMIHIIMSMIAKLSKEEYFT